MGGEHDVGGQVTHVRGDGNFPHQLAEGQRPRPRHHALHADLAHLRRAVDDLGQILQVGVLYPELDEEEGELGVGEWIRPLDLDGVLVARTKKGWGSGLA
jgi:hypothetical protein